MVTYYVAEHWGNVFPVLYNKSNFFYAFRISWANAKPSLTKERSISSVSSEESQPKSVGTKSSIHVVFYTAAMVCFLSSFQFCKSHHCFHLSTDWKRCNRRNFACHLFTIRKLRGCYREESEQTICNVFFLDIALPKTYSNLFVLPPHKGYKLEGLCLRTLRGHGCGSGFCNGGGTGDGAGSGSERSLLRVHSQQNLRR